MKQIKKLSIHDDIGSFSVFVVDNLLMSAYLDPRVEGVIINPFTQAVVVDKHYLEMILESVERHQV